MILLGFLCRNLSYRRNLDVVVKRVGHRAVAESEGKILILRIVLDVGVIVLGNTNMLAVNEYRVKGEQIF